MAALLSWLSRAVARLERLQQRPAYRAGGVALGLLLCGLIVASEPPPGLSVAGWRTLGVTLLMALWWLGAVLPLTVTALVPLIAFPLLQIAPIREVATPYAHPLIFLMLGGFLLGRAMEEVGLHERLVAGLLRPAALRRGPRRTLLGLMVAAAVLSGLVSNTATTVMMLPLALLLAERSGASGRGRSAFALGLAYASSIGGVATLVGTFPNAVFAQVSADQVGREISFAQWLGIGGPFALVAVPIAWWVITRLLVPDSKQPIAALPIPAWRPGERSVIAIVGLAMLAWLTRRPMELGVITLPGWSRGLGLDGMVDDAWVAMVASVALFVLPSRGGPLLDFRAAERALPWSVLFLLGGGFSLASTIRSSGLTSWLAGATQHLDALPHGLDVALICLSVTFLTELTSNTATTQILLPLLAAGADRAGTDPMIWMVPATISASCAFMMPVATPPNAIAAQGGSVSPGDMAAAGLLLNLLLAALATLAALLLAPWVFPS